MISSITVTNPAADVTRTVQDVTIDFDAKVVNYGPCVVKASDALMAELKKCLDAELPNDPKYKSHNISFNVQP